MGLEYELFMNKASKNLEAMPLRSTHKILQNAPKDMISFSNGLPNEACFLFETLSIKLWDGTHLDLDTQDLAQAQQYTANTGFKDYQQLLRDLVHKLHDPPCWNKSPEEGQTAILPTAGATDGISQVLELIVEPGDYVLMEEFSYPGPIATLNSLGAKPVLLTIDGDGIMPQSLREALSRWDPKAKPGTTDKPKLLYTIPTGQNPAGCTLSIERKKEIYKIAQEYNFLIFEDDPYYMLTYGKREPSFLSLDTDGRVLRADSFSKTVSPGIRAGYLSAPYPLSIKIQHRLGVSTHGTPPFSQMLMLKVFSKLGIDGFLEKAERTMEFYRKQRDALVEAIELYLKDQVEYTVPTSGMFVWMKIKGCDDTKDLALNKGIQKGVFVLPGNFFSPVPDQKSSSIRVSFSTEKPEVMREGIKRLSAVIQEYTKVNGGLNI